LAFCNKCGAQVPDGAAFCQVCGAPIAAAGNASSGPTPTTGLSTLLNSRAAQEYWVRRLVAYVIDAIIVYVIIGVLVAATSLPAYFAGLAIPGSSSPIAFFGGFFSAIAGIIFVVYFTLLEFSYGRTVGKSVLGLRVKTDNGSKLTFNDALIRNVSKIYWVLLLLDVILGLALETGYTKKYTDKYADTTVSPAAGTASFV
jgi:uncharacterized RDD family membrane protein YckC